MTDSMEKEKANQDSLDEDADDLGHVGIFPRFLLGKRILGGFLLDGRSNKIHGTREEFL